MSVNPITVQPTENIGRVNELMRSRKVHHVCVVSASALVGIISDRDIARSLPPPTSEYEELYAWILSKRMAREIMTPNPMVIDPDETVKQAALIFLQRDINCLPVVDDGCLVGIMTPRDCLRAFCGE